MHVKLIGRFVVPALNEGCRALVPGGNSQTLRRFIERQTLPKSPHGLAFILLLGLMVALPGFTIDMALPALTDTALSLGVPTHSAGLTISCFMISFGISPLIYGPISDRYGRKPVVTFGCIILIIAGFGCVFAPSLPTLLVFRIIQGLGAGAMPLSIVIARETFDESVVRQKLSYIVMAIYVSPITAPSIGAALLSIGNWRFIYAVLTALAILLLIGIIRGLDNGSRSSSTGRVSVSSILRDYRVVLGHPVARAYILATTASFGVSAAYLTGSALFFVQIAGMSPNQYGTIFGLTALASIGGAFVDGRLSARGISFFHIWPIGFAIWASVSLVLLTMTLTGWMPVPLVIALFATMTFSGGMIAPGMMQGALQQLPQIAGTVSATSNSLLMISGSIFSGLTTILFDGHTALSMTGVMAACSIVCGIFSWMAVRQSWQSSREVIQPVNDLAEPRSVGSE
jgi:MFS transporter, DHA1 family, multidrug resistance protein